MRMAPAATGTSFFTMELPLNLREEGEEDEEDEEVRARLSPLLSALVLLQKLPLLLLNLPEADSREMLLYPYPFRLLEEGLPLPVWLLESSEWSESTGSAIIVLGWSTIVILPTSPVSLSSCRDKGEDKMVVSLFLLPATPSQASALSSCPSPTFPPSSYSQGDMSAGEVVASCPEHVPESKL